MAISQIKLLFDRFVFSSFFLPIPWIAYAYSVLFTEMRNKH